MIIVFTAKGSPARSKVQCSNARNTGADERYSPSGHTLQTKPPQRFAKQSVFAYRRVLLFSKDCAVAVTVLLSDKAEYFSSPETGPLLLTNTGHQLLKK